MAKSEPDYHDKPKPHEAFGIYSKFLNVMYITQTTEVSIYGTFTHVRVHTSFSVE